MIFFPHKLPQVKFKMVIFYNGIILAGIKDERQV